MIFEIIYSFERNAPSKNNYFPYNLAQTQSWQSHANLREFFTFLKLF